jgi:glutamate decarboxylase
LRERGWLVPAYSMPPNREDLVIQRILIRHGFTRAMADELLLEMQSVLDHFAQHPPEESSAYAGAESGSHDHSGR